MAEETAATTDKKSNKGLIGLIAGIAAAVVAVVVIVIIALNSTPKVVGKYNIVSFIENGEESTTMIDFLKAFGGDYVIEFKKDKTGTMEVKGADNSQTVNFKWDDKKIKIEQDGKTEESDYTYKDDTVTLTFEGQGMKFKREGK